jgi:hypothetical protein
MRDEKRDSNFFDAKKSTDQSVDFLIISWLRLRDVFQTFDSIQTEDVEQGI